MKAVRKDEYIFAAALIFGAALSFTYHATKNRYRLDNLLAPVVVNVELNKSYANDTYVLTESGNRLHELAPASTEPTALQNTVMYVKIDTVSIQELFFRCTKKETIDAIDNITVFVGNNTCYFSKATLATWRPIESKDGLLLKLPIPLYAKSFIRPWINSYGGLNFVLREIMEFLTNPLSFPITLICILLLVSMFWYKNKLVDWAYAHKRESEIILVFLLLLFAFLLRINGYTRFSAGGDELYSSCSGANPHLPWINIMNDPGQPPLYYLLLRIWFLIFGWTETTGRMLSVITGTLGILTLYGFVKMMSGRKYAFFAAFLLAINLSHIYYSNEIRMYILLMTIIPLAAQVFFLLLRKGNLKHYLLYILLGVLTVNMHYYGILFICANFLIYILYNYKKIFTKTAAGFLLANIAIAISFLPFFFYTALPAAWRDKGFNSLIPKPDEELWMVFIFAVAACVLYPVIKRQIKAVKSHSLIEYAIYACSFIFILIMLISLKRPILRVRYLCILLPLLCSIFPVLIFNKVDIGKAGSIIKYTLILFLPYYVYNLTFGGNYNFAYKELYQYMAADISTNSLKKHSELIPFLNPKGAVFFLDIYNKELLSYNNTNTSSFYNTPKAEFFPLNDGTEVLYIYSRNYKEKLIYNALSNVKDKTLKIQTPLDKEYIYKIYLK
ncbi:MAG: glycosyltransferase family 39 protein [Oscillospiraceae bacterium]|nr:glycosyltransferase family 39 protein [Oscillospiraceae bacterium]